MALGLRSGTVLGDRFEVGRVVGRGASGLVYQGRDRADGSLVALKLVVVDQGAELERFLREAQLLARVQGPHVVRYVGQGVAPDNRLFLAMEWLEGMDLQRWLARGAPSPTEALAIARGVAEGLAAAHRVGVVHRDVKPANIFLVQSNSDQVKVIDFGIACASDQDRLTRTGVALGTVGYIAPEQILGERTVDARADVFALGCVLYELLSGRPAFGGEHGVAVLGKVLREEPRPLASLAPELPLGLTALVARMLSKRTEERPADAGAVLEELNALGTRSLALPGRPRPRPPGYQEQCPASVVMVAAGAGRDRAVLPEAVLHRVEVLAGDLGARVVPLSGSVLLVSLAGGLAARDSAEQAVCLGAALAAGSPTLRVTVATGFLQLDDASGMPTGPAVDTVVSIHAARVHESGVVLSATTAALLGTGWRVEPGSEGANRLLGPESRRATTAPPLVGRERDERVLKAAFDESVAESAVTAVLLLGGPGVGKSALLDTFRERWLPSATTVQVRASRVRSSGLALARAIIRDLCEIAEAAPESEQRRALLDHAAALAVDTTFEAPVLTAELLAELLGLTEEEGPVSAEIREVRRDSRVLSRRLTETFSAWLEAESRRRPLALLIDDLQCADSGSVDLLLDALGRLADCPVFVLLAGRPEVAQVFPSLLERECLRTHRLRPLPDDAARELVRREAPALTEEEVARVVALSEGVPWLLRALAPTFAEGEVSEAVLLDLASRLVRLDPESRRLLRALSVSPGGVEGALLAELCPGPEDRRTRLLAALRATGFLASDGAHGRWCFRNELVRIAAYAQLTPADRRAAHQIAAEWMNRRVSEDTEERRHHLEYLARG